MIRDWERSCGAYNDIIRILLNYDIGIIQLPCPEFTYQGEARPSKTKEAYDIPAYRTHCSQLAAAIVDQVMEYREHGYHILGFLGIQESPTCDTKTVKGILTEELFKLLAKENIIIDTIDIPADYLEGAGGPILNDLKEFIENHL